MQGTMNHFELWLLRHAQAANDSDSGRDYDRPLTETGLAMCDLLHTWLIKHLARHKAPQAIFYSPALRTRQTIQQAMGQRIIDREWVEPLPLEALWGASAGDLVEIISTHAPSQSPLWLVGHNPGLSNAVSWLADDLPWPGMKPGTLVRLEVPLPIEPHRAKILEVVYSNPSID